MKESEIFNNIPLNTVVSNDCLSIHFAALHNNLAFFERIDINQKLINIGGGMYNSNALQFAIYNKNYKVILFLLLNNTDIRYKNSKGFTCYNLIYKYDDVLSLILIKAFYLNETILIENKIKMHKPQKSDRYKRKMLYKYLFRNYHKQVIDDMFIINKYFLICILIYQYDKMKNSRYFLFLNIVYSLELYNDEMRYLCILFYAILIYLSIYKNEINLKRAFVEENEIPIEGSRIKETPRDIIEEKIQQKKSNDFIDFYESEREEISEKGTSEMSEFLTRLVLEDKYTLDTFCYICLNEKYYHCRICEGCVINHHHHCIFLNNCVSNKNYFIFYFYILLYLLLLAYNIYISDDAWKKLEYSLIILVILRLI